jgi:hypothetical protein
MSPVTDDKEPGFYSLKHDQEMELPSLYGAQLPWYTKMLNTKHKSRREEEKDSFKHNMSSWPWYSVL